MVSQADSVKADDGGVQRPSFRLLRWLLTWMLLYLVGLLLYNVSYPWTRGFLIHDLQVKPATAILRAMLPDEPIHCEGENIYSNALKLGVQRGCDGVEAWVLLATALAAFPMGWKRRIRSMIYGTLLIYTLNLVRIVSIFHLTRLRPDLFDIIHGFIWQTILVLAAVIFVLAWLRPGEKGCET